MLVENFLVGQSGLLFLVGDENITGILFSPVMLCNGNKRGASLVIETLVA